MYINKIQNKFQPILFWFYMTDQHELVNNYTVEGEKKHSKRIVLLIQRPLRMISKLRWAKNATGSWSLPTTYIHNNALVTILVMEDLLNIAFCIKLRKTSSNIFCNKLLNIYSVVLVYHKQLLVHCFLPINLICSDCWMVQPGEQQKGNNWINNAALQQTKVKKKKLKSLQNKSAKPNLKNLCGTSAISCPDIYI